MLTSRTARAPGRGALVVVPALAVALAAAACNPSDSQGTAPAPAVATPPAAAAPPARAAMPATCTVDRTGAAAERELATCLTADVRPPGRATAGRAVPVVLYVDRSGSMRGFLDPAYPTHTPTDFRAVLDRLVVGLRPEAGYSFGAAVVPVTPSLATFDDRAFYADKDTRVEAVLDRIRADTGHARTHIIVGDGRRGSPNAADGQYVRMRDLAEAWTRAGGTFLVGASMAPFKTVASDPSGCRSEVADDPRQTCPLYAFAFVAPGADEQVRAAFAEAFEHVFADPQPAVPPAAVTLVGTPPTGIDVNRRWAPAPGGATVVRVNGARPAQAWATLRVQAADTTVAAGRVDAAFLRGQGATARVTARALRAQSAGVPWGAVGPGAPVRATPGAPLAVDVTTRGPTAPVGLYRVDFTPTGEPSWLADFDATSAGDRLRTYGLGRLFEASRQRARALASADSAAVVRLLFVIN